MAPLALYVHWPFCVSKCPYCDFNSHVRASVDVADWRDALLSDLAHEAERLPGRRIGSIFFGGGTPSLMPPQLVDQLIAAAQHHWPTGDPVEITLEANPSSVEAGRFADLARAGVNRLSLGIQALDDPTLRFLGRAHSVREGLDALDIAQRHFGRVSFDLITARPGQSVAQWQAELARALSFGTSHLSLYQLTIEPGTRFAWLHQQGELTELDDDVAADLFEATRAMMDAAGLPAYEVSNHARPGDESRHNLAYWRYHDYAGIGPGAHGRRGGMATQRHKKPENYLRAVRANGHGLSEESALDPRTRAREALLMGLRLTEGVELGRIAARTGIARADLIDESAARRLADHGLLERIGPDRLIVTPRGIAVLDAILTEIII